LLPWWWRCHRVLHGFLAPRLLPVLPEFPDAVETRLRDLPVVLANVPAASPFKSTRAAPRRMAFR